MMENLQPGRELDAFIAERVMGAKPKIETPEGIITRANFATINLSRLYAAEIPKYSTDISAAWEVVDKVQTKVCGDFKLTRHWWDKLTEWHCSFSESGEFNGMSISAPHAICLAALKAV